MKIENCELCQRDNLETTEHHLTPKEEGGTFLPTAWLCIPCHKQVHALYTNKELAINFNTIQKLKDSLKIKSFIKWIRKQPSSAIVKTKKSNHKKIQQS